MRVRNAHRSVMALVVVFWLGSLASPAQSPVPRSSHVVFIMEENTSYSTTLAQMPWLVSQGSAYGHTT